MKEKNAHQKLGAEASPSQALIEELISSETTTNNPKRSVERLLTENSLSECFQFYESLQQTIKSNTGQLRRVLYNKHENLYQCSQALDSIKAFTSKIDKIETNIHALISKAPKGDLVQESVNQSIISRVEQKVAKQQFWDAMELCKSALLNIKTADTNQKQLEGDICKELGQRTSSQKIDEADRYYLNYLKVEIIERMEALIALENDCLKEHFLSEFVQTLIIFQEISSLEDLQNISSKSQRINQSSDEGASLIGLMHAKINSKLNQQNQRGSVVCKPLLKKDLVEVIFEFKMLNLAVISRGSHKSGPKRFSLKYQTKNQESIEAAGSQTNLNLNSEKELDDQSGHIENQQFQRVCNFFVDLKRLLHEEFSTCQSHSESLKKHDAAQGSSNLKRIFQQKVPTLMHNFGEIFIRTKAEKQSTKQRQYGRKHRSLFFEIKLYERLLNSKEFMETLEVLSAVLLSDKPRKKGEQSISLIAQFKNIWKDYYHQLLDILCDRINPISFISKSQDLSGKDDQKVSQEQSLKAGLPSELSRFRFISRVSVSKIALQLYQSQIRSFCLNLNQLLIDSEATGDQNEILEYLEHNIDQMRQSISKFFSETSTNHQESFHDSVLLFLLIQTSTISLFSLLINQSHKESLKEVQYALVSQSDSQQKVSTLKQRFLFRPSRSSLSSRNSELGKKKGNPNSCGLDQMEHFVYQRFREDVCRGKQLKVALWQQKLDEALSIYNRTVMSSDSFERQQQLGSIKQLAIAMLKFRISELKE